MIRKNHKKWQINSCKWKHFSFIIALLYCTNR